MTVTRTDWRAWAQDLPVLDALPEGLRRVAERQVFGKSERIGRQGECPSAIFCVLSGELRLVRVAESGRETVLQRVGRGFVAEASLDVPAYHCDLVAGEGGQLLRFPRQAFAAALEDDRGFNRAWIAHLSAELRRARSRNECLACPTAAERIRHAIAAGDEGGSMPIRQTRKAWAAELGLSHEALYRALGRLRGAGVIVDHGDRIEWSGGDQPRRIES